MMGPCRSGAKTRTTVSHLSPRAFWCARAYPGNLSLPESECGWILGFPLRMSVATLVIVLSPDIHQGIQVASPYRLGLVATPRTYYRRLRASKPNNNIAEPTNPSVAGSGDTAYESTTCEELAPTRPEVTTEPTVTKNDP